MQTQAYQLDEAIAPCSMGLIVLQSDEVIEGEFRQIFQSQNFALHHSRIENSASISVDTLSDMEEALPAAVRLLPSRAGYRVIGYGCTSGATVIGSDKVAAIIQKQFPEAKVTDPIDSVLAALKHLKVKRIGLLTPYERNVSEAMIALLESNDYCITQFASFGVTDDHLVAHISPQSIKEGMIEIGKHDDVDVVFASCTNLRGLSIIKAAEEELGKPVLTSNQALAWHMQQLLNAHGQTKAQFGKLFSH